MTYKLIILDLDHTLLREDHTLSAANIQAVQRCLKAGIGVTLATGRRLHSALPFARQLGITLPVITCQGAMLSTLSGDILYQQLLDNHLAQQLLIVLNRYPLENIICCHQEAIYATQARADAPDPAGWVAAHPQHSPMPDDLDGICPLKVGASGNPEVIAQAQADISRQFASAVHAVQSSAVFLEITIPLPPKAPPVAQMPSICSIRPAEKMPSEDARND